MGGGAAGVEMGWGFPHANTRIARSGCQTGALFQVPGVSGPAGDHDRG